MSTNDPGMVPPPPEQPTPAPAQPFAAPGGTASFPPYGTPPGAYPPVDAPSGDAAPAGYGVPPQAGYGQPPQAGYGYPPQGPGAPGGKGLAVAALVVAIVALLLSWVPVVNNVAAVLAVAGLVLGIVGIVRAVKGRPGKGMSIAATVISVVALVAVVTTQVAYSLVLDQLVEELDGIAAEELTGAGSATQAPAVTEDEPAADAPAAQDLVVVEAAFGQDELDPTTWWYVVIMENPNPEHAFGSAIIDVEAVGADGTILDTDKNFADVLPGRFALTGMFMSTGAATIDRLDVRGPDASDALHEPELGGFSVADVAATGDDWSTTVGGTVSGTFAEDQELVRVDVIARDAQGQIVAGDFTFVDRLPVDGQARFELTFFEVLPPDTTYEVYVAL